MASKTRIRRPRRKSENRRSESARSPLATNPLSRFLHTIEDGQESRLDTVAMQVISEAGFDPAKLQDELTQKLKRVKYPSPRERTRNRTTFYEYLRQRHGIQRLLQRSTLEEIWGCLSIPPIIQRDRELGKKHLSVHGYPLAFHRKLVREAEKRLDEIEDLIEKFGRTDWMEKYQHSVGRQLRDSAILVILSRTATGKRGELLGPHWKEQVAARLALYWILREKLRGPQRIPDRFVRQLTLLITAPVDVTILDADEAEALRDAIENSEEEWRNPLKISPKK